MGVGRAFGGGRSRAGHGEPVDLDVGAADQAGDLDESHRRVVAVETAPEGVAELCAGSDVRVQIGDEDAKMEDVPGSAAGRAHRADDVPQRRVESARKPSPSSTTA